MAVSLPYLVTYKNLPTLFEKIASAKIPDSFNHAFLQTIIGLKGSNDRALIPLLRGLGFIEQSGVPTQSYRLLKGENSKAAIAEGVRKAYRPLFDADQNAHKLSSEKLKSLVAQVAGTDDDLTGRIAGTLSALTKLGNFDAEISNGVEDSSKKELNGADTTEGSKSHEQGTAKGLRTEFHYNIQVHLPSNGTEEIYLNIFNALRKTFQ